MSHVVSMGLPIDNIEWLVEAAAELGLEVRDKTTFRWYGHHVGDYPLPTGFTKDDMGRCEFALGIRGNYEAYEVGVVKRRDGKPGYDLLWDFWSGGKGLQAAVGDGGGKLKAGYCNRVMENEAIRLGYRVGREVLEDGTVRLRVRS